jgi:hypothetical protein
MVTTFDKTTSNVGISQQPDKEVGTCNTGISSGCVNALTLNLLTTTIVAPNSNASKWQMGFNSPFKGLKHQLEAHEISEMHIRTYLS